MRSDADRLSDIIEAIAKIAARITNSFDAFQDDGGGVRPAGQRNKASILMRKPASFADCHLCTSPQALRSFPHADAGCGWPGTITPPREPTS
jgi:hypothetical protein